MAGLPQVREKSGKTYFFQGQGKVREFCEESGKNMQTPEVREKSGNFVRKAREFFLEKPAMFFFQCISL